MRRLLLATLFVLVSLPPLQARSQNHARNLARPDGGTATLLPVRFTRMHSHCFTPGLGCEF